MAPARRANGLALPGNGPGLPGNGPGSPGQWPHIDRRLGSWREPGHWVSMIAVATSIRHPHAEQDQVGSVEVAAVVEGFTRAWAEPDLERFMALLHPDVVLLQPVTKPIRGREAARREFTRLLAWLPDMRGVVDHWSADDATALIAWRLRFTLARRPFELRMVDRIVVADGLIREREAYYDSLGFMIALLGRPSAWPGYWRYRGYLPAQRSASGREHLSW